MTLCFLGEHIPSQSDGDRGFHCCPSRRNRAKEGRAAILCRSQPASCGGHIQRLRLREQKPKQPPTVDQTLSSVMWKQSVSMWLKPKTSKGKKSTVLLFRSNDVLFQPPCLGDDQHTKGCGNLSQTHSNIPNCQQHRHEEA